jgi:elongation factor G
MHSITEIRNLALIGQTGAGKSSLVKQLLSKMDAGLPASNGNGLDHETLDATPWFGDYQGVRINLLDSPGYPDLTGRAMEVLAAGDTAVLVLNASRGVEVVSQQLMKAAAERHMCRMIVINHIDDPDVDYPALMDQIAEVFGEESLPLNLPKPAGDGVADCFFQPDDVATALGSVEAAHDALIDQVVEMDEELMEVYLEQGQALNPDQLHDPFEMAMREGHLIPVCFVSAKTGVGISELLKVIHRLCPNPQEGNPPEFLLGEGKDAKPIEIAPSEKGHAIAHVFKVMVDPYVGKLGVFRVYQGKIGVGSQLFIGDGRKPFKVTHLYQLQGRKLSEIRQAVPGDICAVSKVDEIHFDAVLHDSHDEDHHHLRPLDMPPPMYGLALSPSRSGQEQKLSDVLHRIADADPSLRVEHRPRLNETVIWGLGEIHLRSVLDVMAKDYQLEVSTRMPSIEYRETIRGKAEGHHRHKKQTGGAGQFGEVFLRVEPMERGSGFEFVDKVVGGAIPFQFIPAVEKGVRQVMEEGAIAGYPMQDIRVTVYDGKHHHVDSKEIAFVTAGKKALQHAIEAANPILLEPIAKLQIVVPETAMGDISGELSAKQGMIAGTQSLAGQRIEIEAQAPLRALGDFQMRLKSMSGGEGHFTMSFSHYAPVSPELQKELKAARKQA